MSLLLTLTVTTAIASPASSNLAPATGAASTYYSGANSAAGTSGSFAAALGTSDPAPAPSNPAIAPTPLADSSSSQKSAATASLPSASAATKGSQKNARLVVPDLSITALLQVTLPVLTSVETSLDVQSPAAPAAVSSQNAGSNAANVSATGPSQVPQAMPPGFATLLSATSPRANTNWSATLPNSALTSLSTLLSNDAASQTVALPAQTLAGNSEPPAITDATPQDQISTRALLETQSVETQSLETQSAPSLTAVPHGVPQNVDPSAALVATPSPASPSDIPNASQITIASAGAEGLPSKIVFDATPVSLQPHDPAATTEIPSASASTPQNQDGTSATLSTAALTPQVPAPDGKPSSEPQLSAATPAAVAKPNPSLAPTLLSALHATPFFAQSPSLTTTQTVNFGSNSGPSATTASPLPSNTEGQANGGTANNSQSGSQSGTQSGTTGSDTQDPSLHKAQAGTSPQINGFPAAAPQAASAALADPALQAGMPGPTQGAIQQTMQGTAAQPAINSAAHKSDSNVPPSDSPSNQPAPRESPVTAAPGPVQMAQMVSKAAQSEMRIGMNTSAFGNVEVHTVVHANEVGVQIGSEKGDLRSLLANDLPGIANSLQQQNLRLNQVNFHQQGFAFSNQMSSGGDAQPRSFASRSLPTRDLSAELSSAESGESAPLLTTAEAGGLSVLA